jgi:hypothetical protein
MLIKIVGLLLLFILIVFLTKKKEGLMNQYSPITIKKSDADYIYRKMVTPDDILYNVNFTTMNESEIVSDMAYFNNASNILYMINKYSTPS